MGLHCWVMREFDLLRHIYAANAQIDRRVMIPPGDDMAMLRLVDEFDQHRVLAAVDQAIDGIHFNLAVTPLELVGRKAITRSLSDVAAMGAAPNGALVAAALPPDFGEGRATQLFDAMRATAEHYECPLIGGDIAIHTSPQHPLTISVTVLAVPYVRHVATRSGARPGDGVHVTGPLGGSLLPNGLGRHLTFEPRIKLGQQIATELGERLHAMIDISDGLGRDAGHIAEMSRVRIILRADQIPRNPGCDWRRALSDGEDYELCFAAAGDVPTTIAGANITRVGEVLAPDANDPRLVLVRDGDRLIDVAEFGWQHEQKQKAESRKQKAES